MVNGIWQEFLKIAQQEVGSQMVETWLKAVSLQRWDTRERIAYLATPNTFVKDWLRMHYVSLFEEHLSRLLNVEHLKIVFIDEEVHRAELSDEKEEKVKDVVYTPAKLVPRSPEKNEISRKVEGRSLGHINSTYKFDTFVVGPSNHLAFNAAYLVTQKPGGMYNPLFVYGGSGLGKTHLLHAIGNEIRIQNKRATILYQPADRFVNEFINAIRFDKAHQFQAKYRDVDVLLIDDVQFIANKDQTQEAFFHIFNTLYDAHKQIVFSSDTYPQNLNGIAERLRSRLEWGLVADIQLPNLETKMEILKKKAIFHGVSLQDDVAHFLASRVVANVRALEGSLVHVMAVASLTKQPVTVDLAKKILVRSNHGVAPGSLDFDRIVKHVCDHYSLTITDLRSHNRAKELSLARQVAMYLMKKMTNKSLHEIGFFLGRKDHSTVIHAIDKVQTVIKKSPDFSAQLMNLEEKILKQKAC
jgi:chromosomal replication initiator protein